MLKLFCEFIQLSGPYTTLPWFAIFNYYKEHKNTLMEEFKDDPELYRLITNFFRSYHLKRGLLCASLNREDFYYFLPAYKILEDYIKTYYLYQEPLDWL